MSRMVIALVCLSFGLTGCSTLLSGGNNLQVRQGSSSSLVDFLYPDGEVPPAPSEALPQVRLPAKVGLAFVPTRGGNPLSAAEQKVLLDRVAAAFSDRPFVASIQVIPDAYLRNASGVTGMQQTARLFDVDVMGLVSYDQLALSGERDSALLYWTVVGALVVKGNENEVQTMIDTAVFDVTTGRLLFRAPGTDRDRRNSTLMDSGKDLRELKVDGFSGATDEMITNLDAELTLLREAVQNGERVEVAWTGGGGSVDVLLALGLLLMAARRFRMGQRVVASRDHELPRVATVPAVSSAASLG